MENNQISQILTILLIVFFSVLLILIMVYLVLWAKSRKNDQKPESDKIENDREENKENNQKKQTTSLTPIYDFMEFESVQDNMIIQKENFKYVMVIECQGVNYDLMSGMEKIAVEEGFLQFLNTLRHPIQLYVQTRTINLENSIVTYKNRLSQIEAELFKNTNEYENIKNNPNIPEQEKQKMLFSLVKQTNLYEYGKDIIADTQRMSLNKNILSKKYYVIIPYYPSDLGDNEFDSYEIRNLAFSELYTRSQAIIRTLAASNVKGKILDSKELMELLYMAYNRDHEEEFNLDRALQAQYDKLYSTSEDIYKKKIRELDHRIENMAIGKAKEKIEVVRTEAEKQAIKKQEEMDELIDEMAKLILEGNREYIDKETIDGAIKEIDKEIDQKKSKKGVDKDAKEEKTTRARKTNR